jgi:DHA1 family inner membrane transport protein
MPPAVFALAAINIAIGTHSFVFAGLLSELAGDLGITIGTAGLLVPASSITFAVAAPFAAALVSRIERRRVILASLAILSLCNALCAFAPTFGWLLVLRILGGAATAFAGSLATIAVTALVPAQQRGRAFAIVVGGLTVALVLGVPLGTVTGGHFGWRMTFAYSAAVGLFAVLLVMAAVPLMKALPGPRAAVAPLLRNRAILRVFGITVLGFAAAFTIVAYLGPIINRLTGVTGSGVSVLQAFIGIGSFVGLAAGGLAADRRMIRSGLMIAFAVMAIDMLAYSWALGWSPATTGQPFVAGLIFLLASTMFAAVPINLAQLTQLAGPAAPVALALNGSLVSFGQGVGAIWGGAIDNLGGLVWIGAGGAVLAAVAFALAFPKSEEAHGQG